MTPSGCRAGSAPGCTGTMQTDRGQVELEPPKPTFLLSAFNRAKCAFLCAVGYLHQQSLFFEHGWVIFSSFCSRSRRRV